MENRPAVRLYLVRHPKPDIEQGICYGRSDVAVAFPVQSAALQALVPLLPKQSRIYSSPLSRCADFALRLSTSLECDRPILDGRLAELDFGAWEMQSWDGIPREEIDAWADNLSTYRPGGGESLVQAAQRVNAFYKDVMQCVSSESIVICHAGTIRLLLACRQTASLSEMALYAAGTPNAIEYGELVMLDCGVMP